jgi:hypothetical protein
MPVSRVFFYISSGVPKTWSPDKTKSHLFSMLPVKEPPLHVPQWGPYRERCSVSRAIGLIIHSFISLRFLSYGTLPQNSGEMFSHRPRSLTQTEGIHILGFGLVPQGVQL